MGETTTTTALRDWPLPIRLVLAVFLISVSLGYFSALVQLHFQHAEPGKLLPDDKGAVDVYHGGTAQRSQLVRLLEADISKPFNGTGSMRAAFTRMSAGWSLVQQDPALLQVQPRSSSKIVRLLESPREDLAWEEGRKRRPAKAIITEIATDSFNGDGSMRRAFFKDDDEWPKDKEKFEQRFDERNAERLVMIEWLRLGEKDDEASKKAFEDAYNEDFYPLKGRLAELPISKDFMDEKDGAKGVAIGLLFGARCETCHRPDDRAPYGAPRFPLTSLPLIGRYLNKAKAQERPPPTSIKEIYAEREGERKAVISWVIDGANRKTYEEDRYELPHDFQKDITGDFVETEGGKRYARVQSILQARCVRCHSASAGGPAGQYPLDSYERLKPYTVAEHSDGMSLPKLAQTTHVHLLGFSMLFAITGLIFAFTSYPLALRLIFGPFTLLAQVVDISCWWLGRADPNLARFIAVTGGLVAMGLVIQVVGSLFNMFRGAGKIIVLAVLAGGVALIAILYFTVISQQLKQEAGDQAAAVSKP
jgi:hypothetical protein